MLKNTLLTKIIWSNTEEKEGASRIIIVANIIRLLKSRKTRRGAFGTPVRGEDTRTVWVGTPKSGRSFGKPGCREEENIKMDLKKTEWDGVEEIHVAHDWKGIETWLSIKFGKFLIRLVTVRMGSAP